MSKTRKRLKQALMAGAAMYGASKLFGGNKMISGKDSEVGAIAKQIDKLRMPESVKNEKKFKNKNKAESLVHNKLKKQNIEHNCEWFRIPKTKAVKIIKSIKL